MSCVTNACGVRLKDMRTTPSWTGRSSMCHKSRHGASYLVWSRVGPNGGAGSPVSDGRPSIADVYCGLQIGAWRVLWDDMGETDCGARFAA